MKKECKIENLMILIGKKWMLMIIKNLIDNKNLRYKDLYKSLNGISPKTLSDRLKELEKMKVLDRRSFAQIPPRVEYSLTKKGEELGMALMPVVQWSLKWES